MLTSYFGLSLRKWTSMISILNASASFIYIISNIFQYTVNYGYPTAKTDAHSHDSTEDTPVFLNDMFLNYITLLFVLVGSISMFANLSLRQATLENATHKIYLWLVITYVQIGTIFVFQFVVLTLHVNGLKYLVGLIVCFILLNAIFVFEILIVQSFYVEEKLSEETNYQRLCSELSSQIQQNDEFENVEL